MLCRNCGAQIPDNSKFCVECGTKIETEQIGVDRQRVISDKHYSLEDIAKQQNESNNRPLGEVNTQPSSVSVKEQPSANPPREQQTQEQKVSPFDIYKNRRQSGYSSGAEQSGKISPFDTYKTRTNNNSFGTGTTQPQTNNNYSFGGTQPDTNNNSFGTGTTQPQTNNNYSFGGTQPDTNNNSFGTGTAQPQANNNSFTQPRNYNNIDNAASKSNNKTAKIMLIVGIAVMVVLVAAIVIMLVSGYYNTDNDGSNTNIVTPANSDNVNFSDVVYSNQANYAIAAEDDAGNVYYVSDSGYVIKKETSGKETEIYDNVATSLNYYDGRLYFIAAVSGYDTVCSIKVDGTDLKTHTKQKDVSTLSVADGYAYYAINNYGSSLTSGAVFRVNLSSGNVDNVTVESNADVYAVFDYKDSIYVYSMSNDDLYIGTVKEISKSDLKQVKEINRPSSEYGQEYDYYAITVSGDKFYFSNYDEDKGYTLYSMNMDGSGGVEIGGINSREISVYGDYIYYISGNDSALRRIKTDGSEDVCIKDKDVALVSFAGDTLYYVDWSTKELRSMNLDGSNDHILK